MISSRKYPTFYRGVLESSGLGETSYYLKKTKTNLEYALVSLQNTDFSESAEILHSVVSKVSAVELALSALRDELLMAERLLVADTQRREEEVETQETQETQEA